MSVYKHVKAGSSHWASSPSPLHFLSFFLLAYFSLLQTLLLKQRLTAETPLASTCSKVLFNVTTPSSGGPAQTLTLTQQEIYQLSHLLALLSPHFNISSETFHTERGGPWCFPIGAAVASTIFRVQLVVMDNTLLLVLQLGDGVSLSSAINLVFSSVFNPKYGREVACKDIS